MASGGKGLVLVRNLILPAYISCEDGTEGFETSVYKIQTPGNDLKERIQIYSYNRMR